MMLRILALLAALLLAGSAAAQNWPAVQMQPYTGPTPPAGDNSGRLATTAFVATALGGGLPLANGQLFIGNGSNLATANAMSGDCTITNLGVITCTKTNNVSFGALATVVPGANVATFLTTPSSANLGAALTDKTGTGLNVFQTSPTLITPVLGVATATSINGNTFTAGTYTLTGVAGKTLTFNKSITLDGTDGTTMTFPSTNGTIAALNIASQNITGGATFTPAALSTGNITVNCGTNPGQTITNNGAYTITAPATDSFCLIKVTNGASAGATTFSGFSVGSNTGDALTTTNTNKFIISVIRVGGDSTYSIKALQ